MTGLELLVAAAVGVIVVGGSVFFGLRLSRSSMTALHDQVAEINGTLADLARRLVLECRVAPPYRHPVVGDVPAFAEVVGERGGFVLQVGFISDEDSGNYVVTVTPRDEQRWPDLGRLKPKVAGKYQPALAQALAAIADAVDDVRVEPRSLRVVLRPGSPTAPELHTRVDAVLGLAHAVMSTR